MDHISAPGRRTISVFLADDNLIVRESVRAIIGASSNLNVVGLAAHYDEVNAGRMTTEPQVLVTDGPRAQPPARSAAVEPLAHLGTQFRVYVPPVLDHPGLHLSRYLGGAGVGTDVGHQMFLVGLG